MTMGERILEFVIAYRRAHGYSPSTKEIGAGVGLSSTCSVHRQLRKLAAAGRVELTPRVARSVRPSRSSTDSELPAAGTGGLSHG